MARLQLTRQENLDRENATTTEALQSAAATHRSAIAQVDAILAQIKQTGSTLRGDQANLGYTKIYAPMTGTVVAQTAKQGQTLNANQQAPIIMRIANLATMTVQAHVSAADVPKLKIGMDVYFTIGGNNRRHYGKLRQIPPTPTVLNNGGEREAPASGNSTGNCAAGANRRSEDRRLRRVNGMPLKNRSSDIRCTEDPDPPICFEEIENQQARQHFCRNRERLLFASTRSLNHWCTFEAAAAVSPVS